MSRLGSSVLRFDSVASTNDLAREMAAGGAAEGTAILAQEQTAGRGRQGRSWTSPPGEGLYLSLILRPNVRPAGSPIITLAAAVAVAETLSIDFNLPVDIKWPNDVLARGRKICGILVESAIERAEIQYAVMGIGLNISQREFPDELKQSATSLLIETGQTITADDLLKPLFERLEYWYRKAIRYPERVIAQWEHLSTYARGCAVRIETTGEIIEGETQGLAASGALKIKLESGEAREVVSGEVRLRRKNAE
jgi:BirA family biotin operon repressor/biotin-[acetyl-CoA-carboxylase] ligase